MILSAIYIENNFLFDQPQIINFGGSYYFEFSKDDKQIYFSKFSNVSKIENYFGDISMISAIVGANGAGKTNILRAINQDSDAILSILIYEEGENIFILDRNTTNIIAANFEYEKIQNNEKLHPLYYSPSIDYDIQDIYSPISLSRSYNDRLSEYYFNNLEKQLFFLNNDLIEVLKEAYHDLPFFTKLNVKVNNFNKDIFLNVYKDATLGKSLNEELKALWNKYQSNSETVHNDNDFLKNLKIMLLSLLVLDDTYGVTNDNGFEIGFDEVIEQNTFTKKLNKFLEKRICNIDAPTYQTLKENFQFEINNSQALIDRINRNKLVQISGGFDFNSIKKRMIRCINAFRAVYDFYKFIRNFNLHGRIKKDHQKVFVEFKVEEFEMILKLIKEYEKLISIFKETIQHDNFRILNFYPDKKFSTGEKSLLDFFSSLYYFTLNKSDHQRQNENYLLLLDEPELGYHALWKKKFIQAIVKTVPLIFKELDKKPKVQIIFTTHDALTLSDIPNYNIIYVYKNDNSSSILSTSQSLEKKAFGGNISNILSDSFFIGNGLIGDYVKDKIQDVIEYINDKHKRVNIKWITSHDVAKKVIEQIGEPYLSEKLNDMFLEAFPEFKLEEIKRLEIKIEKLKNDTNSNK